LSETYVRRTYRIKIGDVTFGFEDWFERWWDFFFEEGVPIDAFEERVSFQLSSIFS
jgi:hypothetical protein